MSAKVLSDILHILETGSFGFDMPALPDFTMSKVVLTDIRDKLATISGTTGSIGADVTSLATGVSLLSSQLSAAQASLTSLFSFWTPVADTRVSLAEHVFDLSANNIFFLTLNESLSSVSLASPKDGTKYLFLLKQGAGSKVVNWPSNVKWRGAAAPTLSTAAGAVDLAALVYSAAFGNFYADASLNFA